MYISLHIFYKNWELWELICNFSTSVGEGATNWGSLYPLDFSGFSEISPTFLMLFVLFSSLRKSKYFQSSCWLQNASTMQYILLYLKKGSIWSLLCRLIHLFSDSIPFANSDTYQRCMHMHTLAQELFHAGHIWTKGVRKCHFMLNCTV